MPAIAALSTVIIDCADPAALAEFYGKVTGWPVTYRDDDAVHLGDGSMSLGFQRIDGYQGPGWPDAAKHAHLDFAVTDVDSAVKELLSAGATLPEFQPGEGEWTVMADPEGHLFCIAAA